MSLYGVNVGQAYNLVKLALSADLVPHLISAPGVGKSATAKRIAKEFNLELIDYRAAGGLPEDQSGLPWRDGEISRFLPFAEEFPIEGLTKVPEGKKGFLLFLDEIDAASREMAASLYRLIYDREVGKKKLHSLTYIITAGNGQEHNAISNNHGTAMQSRMSHIRVLSDTKYWIEEVCPLIGIDYRVLAFISAFPAKLNDFNPDHEDLSFCCERTWEAVSKICKQFPSPDLPDWTIPLISGTITSGVGAEFVQFTQVFKSIPKFQDVVKDPLAIPVPDIPTLKWATICSLAQNLSSFKSEEPKKKDEVIEACVKYVEQYPLTYQIVFGRMVVSLTPTIRTNPKFIKLLVKINKDIND